MYDGSNTASEHTQEATRLGGADAYRVRMVNALLSAAQTGPIPVAAAHAAEGGTCSSE